MIRILNFFLLPLALFFIGCERMDTMENTYPNFETAMQNRAIGEGRWIPRFLPTSATDIIEKHNLDTNELWLFFHFNTSDLTSMAKSCKQVAQSKIVFPRKKADNWWPQILTKRFDDTQRQKTTYMYFQCKDSGIMAINIGKKEVYYWDLGS